MPSGSYIPEKSDHQKVVKHEDERVLTAKRKAQAAKDKAACKISAAEGTSKRTKRKKTAPMSFALSESDPYDSTRNSSGTHHSTWPLTTIIPNDTNPTASGSNLALDSSNRPEGDTGNSLDNVKNDTEVNSTRSVSSPHSEHSPQSQHYAHSDEDSHAHSGGDGLYHDEHVRRHASDSTGHVLSSSSGDSGRQVFPQRNPGGDGIGSSLRANVSPPAPFHMDCISKEAALIEKLVAMEKEKDELLDKNRGQEEQIRQLEEALASKTSFVSEEENAVTVLKGDLERLSIDLSHAEIIKLNYVRQLLPTVGVKVVRFDEDAEAILAAAADYDQSVFFIYTLAFGHVTWPLALGFIQSVLRSEKYYSSLGHWHLDSSGASCVLGSIIRHLPIGTWTHRERLAFREILFVTWTLALRLIRSVLRSRKYYSSLGHWHLDLSGASCIPRNIIRHLAIGAWPHPEHLAFREILFVTWPLALRLIRSVLHFGKYYSSLGHRHLDSSGAGNTTGIKIG
ncbi:hypothetical protein Tco_0172647 [Tanacetum coccineum]